MWDTITELSKHASDSSPPYMAVYILEFQLDSAGIDMSLHLYKFMRLCTMVSHNFKGTAHGVYSEEHEKHVANGVY